MKLIKSEKPQASDDIKINTSFVVGSKASLSICSGAVKTAQVHNSQSTSLTKILDRAKSNKW